jgi:hypothetical protein
VQAELAGEPAPIGAGRIQEVLDRLGPPAEWLPAERTAAVHPESAGAEDWRLPYLSIGLFVAAPVMFLNGPYLWPLEPALFAGSLVAARVALTARDERGEEIGARRWLVYPPLLFWYSAIVITLLLWPAPFVESFLEAPSTWERLSAAGYTSSEITWGVRPAILALAMGGWWVALGVVVLRLQPRVRTAFHPFANWFGRRHAMCIVWTGVVLAALSGVLFSVWG